MAVVQVQDLVLNGYRNSNGVAMFEVWETVPDTISTHGWTDTYSMLRKRVTNPELPLREALEDID